MSFLGWLTSTPGFLTVIGSLIAVAVTGLIWDHLAHPEPGQPDPAIPALTPAEQAMLASLALRYAHSDPAAGRMLADYLRTKCPGISDLDLMRCVIALGHVARYFHRNEPTAGDALAAYLHAMAGAALDLTAVERDEIPR